MRHFKDFPSSSPPLSANSKHLGYKNTTLFMSRQSCLDHRLYSSMLIWTHSQSQFYIDTISQNKNIHLEVNNVFLFSCDRLVPAKNNSDFRETLHHLYFLDNVINLIPDVLCEIFHSYYLKELRYNRLLSHKNIKSTKSGSFA